MPSSRCIRGRALIFSISIDSIKVQCQKVSGRRIHYNDILNSKDVLFYSAVNHVNRTSKGRGTKIAFFTDNQWKIGILIAMDSKIYRHPEQ